MAHYAIGDVQGCFQELTALLNKIQFNHGTDTLWLVGDLVNRGKQSLACLEFAMRYENSVQMVLGNHDLHLLALSYGYGKLKASDTIGDILNHPQQTKMRDWLRAQPLMRQNQNFVLVHAGLLPQWNIEQAQSLAQEVEQHLTSKHALTYFANMYGNHPTLWHDNLTGYERLRLITNVFTRMRALDAQQALDYSFKATLAELPPQLTAWFDVANRQHLDKTIVFGHWSALGYRNEKKIIALDTGALWGGRLTAIDLNKQSISQVESFQGNKLNF